MPESSLYLEFADAKAVACARLWPPWASHYPGLRPDRWYRVWDVGQDAHGVFLDVGAVVSNAGGVGRPRYVARSHFQIERMPSAAAPFGCPKAGGGGSGI